MTPHNRLTTLTSLITNGYSTVVMMVMTMMTMGTMVMMVTMVMMGAGS